MNLSEVSHTVVHYLIFHVSELSFCNDISIECLVGSVHIYSVEIWAESVQSS
jgi:hypothetical protein